MTSKETEKYIQCEVCGKTILEKCAIEDDGLLKCGDCVVLSTDKEVKHVEKISEQQRKEEYALVRQELIRKQRIKTLWILVVCISTFIGVQIFNHLNRPEPVRSIHFDSSKEAESMRSFIVFAIHDFKQDNMGSLPDSLPQLIPDYFPESARTSLEKFSYKKNENNSFTLILISNEELRE